MNSMLRWTGVWLLACSLVACGDDDALTDQDAGEHDGTVPADGESDDDAGPLDAGGEDGAVDDRERCGPVLCPEDEICCDSDCGQCATDQEACGTLPIECDPCEPMDAHEPDEACPPMVIGYKWDGETCTYMSCGCEGTHCDYLFDTLEACQETYEECLGKPCGDITCPVGMECCSHACEICTEPGDVCICDPDPDPDPI